MLAIKTAAWRNPGKQRYVLFMPTMSRLSSALVFTALALMPRAPSAGLLSRYDTSPDRAVRLPAELREISGLAWTPDGRLFGHNDEVGILYDIDPVTGAVRQRYPLSASPPRGDFEALTVTPSGLALATSDGTVLDLALPRNGAPSVRGVVRTGLGAACDVEGIASHRDTLFLACKEPTRTHILIHRRDRKTGASLGAPITVALASLTKNGRPVHPSDLVRDSTTGHFLMLAARDQMLMELSGTGRVVQSRKLADGHRQAEGIALSKDGALYIADEGAKAPGTLATYAPKAAR